MFILYITCRYSHFNILFLAKGNVGFWHPSSVNFSHFNILFNARVISLLAVYYNGEVFFRNEPIRNKNCLWRPCLLMDRDEMSNLYRGPSIDASYQVSEEIRFRQVSLYNFDLRLWTKGNVSFCHHLASVVRRPLTFRILIFSSETSCFWLADF
jgi:hypothetical protein